MNRTQQLRRNVRRLYAFSAFGGASFFCAIIVPFFLAEGLSLRDIFWLQGLFGLFVLLLEVPSGYLADSLGRRRSLLIGSAALSVGYLIYAFAHGFLGFLFAEFALAVGISFLSGADTALLYDTLVELREEDRYARVLARQRSIMNVAGAVSAAAGGALALLGGRVVLWFDFAIGLGCLVMALLLVEPERKILASGANPLKGISAIAREALVTNREVRLLILLSSGVAVATLCTFWYHQPVLLEAGVPVAIFGLVLAVWRIAGALGSLAAPAIAGRLGFFGSALLLLSVFGVSAIGLALLRSAWLGFAFLGFALVRSVAQVVFSEAINRRVESDRRATVLSIESLVMRLWFLPLSAAAGALADAQGLAISILLVSGLLLVVNTILAQRLERVRRGAEGLAPARRVLYAHGG